MSRKCNFCGRSRPNVALAQICDACAKGSHRDTRCDFCNKTSRTEMAWICPECVTGKVGDAWCDFCKKTTITSAARICSSCEA